MWRGVSRTDERMKKSSMKTAPKGKIPPANHREVIGIRGDHGA